jgi:predicted DNA-binding protein YlxM (UPF0122 family)
MSQSDYDQQTGEVYEPTPTPPYERQGGSAVLQAISNIMAEVGSVAKAGKNTFHNYSYTTAADILHKLQPLMAREGLIVFQTETARDMMMDESVLAVTYHFTLAHKDGETWPTPVVRTGMSSARNSKGGFDDKALNKCHTSAHKYFHLTLFEIPTGDYDDADAEEDKPRAKPTSRMMTDKTDAWEARKDDRFAPNGAARKSKQPEDWGKPAQAKKNGDWEVFQAALMRCQSAAEVADLQEVYRETIYPNWSFKWKQSGEEEFEKRLAVFSKGDDLRETLEDSVAEVAAPTEAQVFVYRERVQWLQRATTPEDLKKHAKNKDHAAEVARLTEAQVEDLRAFYSDHMNKLQAQMMAAL